MSARAAVIAAAVTLLHCSSRPAPAPTGVSATPNVTKPASAAPPPVAAPAPAPKRATTKVVSQPFEDAASLPSGEVLVATHDEVLVWDPSEESRMRRAGVVGQKYLHPGSARFVVAHESEDSITVDLWDAAKLERLATLEGTFKGQGFGVVSADGGRFLYGACKAVGKELMGGDCGIAVYALPDGGLVHRTALPRLRLIEYMIVPHLSPSGTYFALSHARLPTRAYESATGKLAFLVTEPREGSQAVFLDDQRLLTSSASGRKLQVTDLRTGKRARGVDVGPADEANEQTVSPDAKRVALIVSHAKPARRELVVWSVDTSAALRTAVPLEVCPEYCEVVWRSAREILVRPYETGAKSRFRFDVESGQGTTESDEELPVFAAGPFQVFGGFSTRTHLVRTDLGPNPRGTTEDGGSVRIDGGAPIPLPRLRSNDTSLRFDGERLVIVGQEFVDVVTKNGVVSELGR